LVASSRPKSNAALASAPLSPSWHVERDVTDLSAIFKAPQTGQAIVYNVVNSTYTGIIYGSAALEFYPAAFYAPAPVVPDIVIPVSGENNAGTLNTTTDQVTQVVNLPRNVEKVYLDVISQSQSADEFWYFNVPNDQTSNLESYGNTAFRETEISIDGKPAGVAPVYVDLHRRPRPLPLGAHHRRSDPQLQALPG